MSSGEREWSLSGVFVAPHSADDAVGELAFVGSSGFQPSHGTDRVFKTWTKTVPIGVDVREAGAGGWSSGKSDRLGTPKKTADDSVLEVEFCDDADWMLAVGTERRCRWVSVDSPAFARSLGYSPWPGVVP